MHEPLFAALAAVVALLMLIGLSRVARGPTAVDRMLGVQLLGTFSIALLLLIGEAFHLPAVRDVALVVALLGAVTAIVFARPG